MIAQGNLTKLWENSPSVLKLFQSIANNGKFTNSFSDVSITWIPGLNNDRTKKENHRPISSMMIDAKILNAILEIPKPLEENNTPWPGFLIPGVQGSG